MLSSKKTKHSIIILYIILFCVLVDSLFAGPTTGTINFNSETYVTTSGTSPFDSGTIGTTGLKVIAQTSSGDSIQIKLSTGPESLGLWVTDMNNIQAGGDLSNVSVRASDYTEASDTDGFALTQFGFYMASASGITITVTPYNNGVAGTSYTSPTIANSTYTVVDVPDVNFQSIDRFDIVVASGTPSNAMILDELVISSFVNSNDTTSTLTAGDGIDESSSINVPTTATISANAVGVFDFAITDTGSGDGLDTTVTSLDIHVSGTNNSKLTYILTNASSGTNQGSDLSGSIVGTYNAGKVTFNLSSNNIVVGDGTTETYVIKAYYNDNTSITDNAAVTITIDGDTDLTVNGSGSTMGTTSIVTNNGNATLSVTATKLVFTTQPAGSTSGSALTTQPVVKAVDAFENVDTDYTSTITLTEASAGSLSGDVDITAVSGVSTFTDVVYTASADQESFTLTASDSSITDATANSVTSDVVATKLIFSTQPAPTSIQTGVNTSFTTVPVVSAVDTNNTVDTGYTTNILLSVTDPNDGIIDGTVNSLSVTTGDQDGDGTTVTLSTASTGATFSSGVATFTGLALQYTDSGISNTIALKATSGALAEVNSSNITSNDTTPPTVSSVSVPANGTYKATQNLDFTVNTNENVTVNTTGGTPRLTLTIGTTTKYATYVSGSGTQALVFRYTVETNLSDTNGIALGGTIDLNSGTLKDSAGNNLVTTLNSVGSLTSVLVDSIVPTLSEITAVTTPSNDSTPNYTFSTSEAGTLAVGGSCGSASEGAVTSGNQTIALTQTDNSSALSDGTYSDCTITVTDAAGNASSALSITSFTVDTAVPTTTFNPTNASNTHPINSAMTITFNEAIRNTDDSVITDTNVDSLITLKDTNSSGTDVPFDATISVDKKVITITPTSNLIEAQVYYLAYSDVEDNAGNTRTGENISFTAAPDTQAPTVSSLSPLDNATNVALDANLVITFSENIQKGTGNIELRLNSDDSLVESFDVATSSKIQISNNILTINPTSNLNINTIYYVIVPNTAIKDVATTPNSFAGILNKGDWNFTTVDNAAPTVTGTSGQTINDNSSILPFSSVVLDDANGDNISVTLSLDDNTKGSLSATSIASDTIANVQAALRAIRFTPARNKLSVGTSETTIITLSVSDGVLTTNDSNTSIVSNSINDAPSNIVPSSSSIKFDSGLNSVVGSLNSSDPDVNSSFTYSLVQKGSSVNGLCTNDSDNNLFSISGSNLIVLNPLNMNGTYNICVQTNDGITTYEKTLPITIIGNSTPVITNIRLLNQSSVAQDEGFNIIAYKNFGTINIEVVASDVDNHNLTYNVTIENQNLFESTSFENNTLSLTSKTDISGNTNITLSVNDGYDTVSRTFKVTILSFEDNDDVEKTGDVTIEVDNEGSEVTTVTVAQDNLSVQTKTKTDGTTQHLVEINGVQTKATSTIIGSNVELTENGVQTTYTDTNVDVKIEASVLGESINTLTTNGQTTSVTSNVIGAQTTLQKDDEGNVEIVILISNMQITIKADGSVAYSIQNDTGSTNVHSNIPGAKTNITPNGNIETSVGNKTDGSSTIKAKSSTTPQGTTVTKFISVDANGNETELDSTLADDSSFANGSNIEIFEQNGVIYIKVTAPLENNLKVK